MKDSIIESIIAVVNALNSISVSGKQNLANLSGSIYTLENVLSSIKSCDIVDNGKQEDNK